MVVIAQLPPRPVADPPRILAGVRATGMYNVYILRSLKSGKRYVGLTSGLPEDRLRQHNSSNKGWSNGQRPFELIYVEEFSDKSSASRRELFFKTGQGRKALDNFLKNSLNRYGGYSSTG